MKRNISIWLTAVAMLLLASCENDIKLDRTADYNRLAVNGYINTDSLTNSLIVTLTDDKKPQPVTNAVVEISVNGERKAVASESAIEHGTYIFKCRFTPGDKVRIDVATADGSRHAYIEETVPQPVGGELRAKAQFVSNAQYLNEDGATETQDMYRINVGYDDDGSAANFYRLDIYTYVAERTIQTLGSGKTEEHIVYHKSSAPTKYVCTGDAVMMEGKTFTPVSDIDFATMNNIANKQGVFNDLLFNGKQCDIYVLEDGKQYGDIHIEDLHYTIDVNYSIYNKIVVSALNATAYYYLKAVNFRSSSVYDDNSDLTGPVRMPSNVSGGTGMVGFMTSKNCILKLKGNEPYPGLE